MKPVMDNIIVKPNEKTSSTTSGIITSLKEARSTSGVVIASGPGKMKNGKLIPTGVCEGDKVIWGHYDGSDTKIDGEDYIILKQDQLLAIYK